MNQGRQNDGPFDFVFMADMQKPETWQRVNNQVEQYTEAGATWWVEEFTPNQYGLQWDDAWPVEALKERIAHGPPSY